MPRAGLGVAALGPNTPLHTPPPGASGYFDRAAATPAQAPPQHQQQQQQQARHFSLSPPLELSPAPCESALPSLQLHLLLRWLSTSLRLTLHTSLLINHPAPAFLELPLDITLTSLELRAGAVVAFEETQEGRRLHLCLTEAMSDEELQAHSSSEDVEQEEGDERLDDIDASPPLLSTPPFATRHRHTPSSTTFATANNAHTTNAPPQTLGERLLPALTLESSVGQADKHTLLNVGKVEKFVAELLRKAVVEEVSVLFFRARFLELPPPSPSPEGKKRGGVAKRSEEWAERCERRKESD
jgi:distribution and morphology protein 12